MSASPPDVDDRLMYEGQFPGPELRVRKGDVLGVELTNDLQAAR